MLPQIYFVSWWRCTAGENEPGPDARGFSAGSSLVVHKMAARAEAVQGAETVQGAALGPR